MPHIIMGSARKVSLVKREQSKDDKISSNSKPAKETEKKMAKSVGSVYGGQNKPLSKSRDLSVSKAKQDVGDTMSWKDRASIAKRQHDDEEKAMSSQRREMSSVRQPVIKSSSLSAGKSHDARVLPASTRPVVRSKPAGTGFQPKSQPTKLAATSKDTPDKKKTNITAGNYKKTPSLPFKGSVAIMRTPRTYKQTDSQKMVLTKPSNTLPKKQDKDKVKSTHLSKVSDAGKAAAVKEKMADSCNRVQDCEAEAKTSISRLGRARTKTRTLSPTEVKALRNIVAKNVEHRKNQDFSSTLSSSKLSSPKQVAEVERVGTVSLGVEADDKAEDDYSEDFEDYESDFEDATDSELAVSGSMDRNGSSASCVSDEGESSGTDSIGGDAVEMTTHQHPLVEEEKKLDSGNYDLAEKRRQGRQLQEIKAALERENSAAAESRETFNKVSAVEQLPSDEGFVEEKPEDVNSTVTMVSNTNFINFANARKRQLEKKATAKAKKRGEELLGMVTLDVVGFSLLDLAPIPYDIYMKSYGRSNTMQVHVQTNEDSISEEVQTDEVHMSSKWTQKPVMFCTKLHSEAGKIGEMQSFTQNHLGVGSDEADEEWHRWENRLTFNFTRLNQFLVSAGQVVSILLEESQMHDGSLLRPSPGDLTFSEGFITLNVESVPFLANRSVTCLCFHRAVPNLLLTVHNCQSQDDGRNAADTEATLGRSMVCVWSVLEPLCPQKMLVASQRVCTACFDATKASLVFGGLADGSVCVWDLREQPSHHKVVRVESSEWTIRSPTYTTAEILKSEGHLGPIVSLQPVIEADVQNDSSGMGEFSPLQVCSLEECGRLLVWTVVRSGRPGEQDLGLAPWGRVRLLHSASVHLGLETQCVAMDLQGGDHLYVATISGQVVHCLRSGGKPQPSTYVSTWGGLSSASCIEPCPFGLPFFLVGCMEGIVRLHSQASTKPLLTLAATGDALGQGPPILTVQWSKSRPFVFFVLDNLSRLHVWDLSVSDMYPRHSVRLAEQSISTIRLSPHHVGKRNGAQLVLASLCGKVEIHQLKEDLVCRSDNELAAELKKFLYYTSLL
ncbi:cytoplasmic dynein 2 intermediate chain 1 isoform X2 [Bacillus rossius redtenbacheri]|uniref:cytoplasmic dynein 2 intermediate chain 1 isoform X2 n=1 Tax=Bacillus rossius redtenbacheri TaxID=93214 RepID=UPI002FDD92A5